MWPAGDQFAHFTTFIFGDYPLACTILHFIVAEGRNPKQRLSVCLLHPLTIILLLVPIKIAPDAIPLLAFGTYPWGSLSIQASVTRSRFQSAVLITFLS